MLLNYFQNFCFIFYNFSRLWEFFKLSTHPYLNLATAKSIFNQEKWPAECVSISFYFLGNFRFFEGPWEFFEALKPALPAFCFIFQTQPPASPCRKMALGNCHLASNLCKHLVQRIAVRQLPKALGSCRCGYLNIMWQLPTFH